MVGKTSCTILAVSITNKPTKMTNTLPTPEVIYADAIFSGYGYQKVTVQLMANGETKKFSAITNYMPGIDAANDLDGQERYNALYELIESDIEEDELIWLHSISD